MKRIVVVFVGLVVVLSVLLGIKVRSMRAQALRPAGGSAVIEAKQADVTSRMAARVASVEVEEGEGVSAGDVIATLECAEAEAMLEAASARLEASERQAEAAAAQMVSARAGVGAAGARRKALRSNKSVTDRTVRRMERLTGEGGATQMDLDRAAAQADNLNEQLRALEASVDVAKGQANAAKAQAEAASAAISAARADVKRARAMVAECTLKAPISGYVQTRAFEPGEVVLPGATLVTIVRLDEVEATFYLPNRELAAARPAMRVELVADALPGRTFDGRIARVASKAEFTPRNVQTREDRDRLVYAVTVTVDNGTEELRPGMPVEVTIPGTGRP